MKKSVILKFLSIFSTIMLFISLLLPYQSATKEYKIHLQENPEVMNIKELNIKNKDVVHISMLTNLKVYSYSMNNVKDNSWLLGEATINFILTIMLIITSFLVLLFVLLNKNILIIIFDTLLLLNSLFMNYDIVSRGVIPSNNYTFGISYWLYPILAITILVLTIISIIKNKKNNS